MSLEVTGPVLDVMDRAEAEACLARMVQGSDMWKQAALTIWHGRGWLALGFPSWDALSLAQPEVRPPKLTREEKQRVMIELDEAGMSQRAIASTLGVGQSSVSENLSGDRKRSPDGPTIGLDGKTYRKRTDPARLDRIQELADSGHSSDDIGEDLKLRPAYVRGLAREASIEIPADKAMGRTRRNLDHDRIVEETVTTLAGLAAGLRLLNLDRVAVRSEWTESLSDSLREIHRLHRALREVHA